MADFIPDPNGALTEAQFLTFLSDKQIFYDDLVGSDFQKDIWTLSGDAGFIYSIGNSILTMKPKATANSFVWLDWNGKGAYATLTQKPITMMTRVAYENDSNMRWRIGLYITALKYVAFELDTSVDNNFRAVCKNTAITSQDTGIAFASHTPYRLTFVIVSNIKVLFYINGALVETIITNIPTVGHFEPLIEAETLAAQALGIFLDKVYISANNYHIAPP